MRTKKRVLQMNEEELAALLAVVMPGRTIDGLRKDERQEMCIKWLFANSLSMNHEFTFGRQDTEIYVLMNNRQPCACCRKDCNTVTMQAFDRTPLGASLLCQEPSGSKQSNEDINKPSIDSKGKTPPPKPARINPSQNYPSSLPNVTPIPPKRSPKGVNPLKPKSPDNILDASRLQPINDRRGVPLKPIRIQPIPDDNHRAQRRKYQCDEEAEKEQPCMTQFVRECGLCCVDLWSNINCSKC